MLTLRPYQSTIYGETQALMRQGVRNVLVQSPTGSGKTALAANMLGSAAEKGMASLFLVHRIELVKQSIRAFTKAELTHGAIATGFMPEPRALVQIGSVQKVARMLGKLKHKPSFIAYDEAHHICAGTWSKIYQAFPKAFGVGFTATPERLDGTGLKRYFGAMVQGPSVAWLIANGYLSPFEAYAPTSFDASGIHITRGDYNKKEVSEKMKKSTITGDAVEHYLLHAKGKRAIAFSASVEKSKLAVDAFNAVGVPAAHIDGETDAKERDNKIRAFEEGSILVLSNVEIAGEGVDIPAIEAVILLRPTCSLGLHLQQVGRALRPATGKTVAVILDHVGNLERHGLPDEEREWSLEGSRRKASDLDAGGPRIRRCPVCAVVSSISATVCQHCGTPFIIVAKERDIKEVEGQLAKVDPVELAKRRQQKKFEQFQARTYEDLVKLGESRKYPNPGGWARMVLSSRGQKTAA